MKNKQTPPIYRTGIGKDSHRFHEQKVSKPLFLGGVLIPDHPGFQANSDGDIILHSLCDAISTLTGKRILGPVADRICNEMGITDSRVYVQEALKYLGNQEIVHVAFSVEGRTPKVENFLDSIRKEVATILEIEEHQVGITATTGEALTDFGLGKGMEALCIVTTVQS